MNCDIIMAVPWQCGAGDCGSPGGWHMSNYWIQDDGTYTVDMYADGDHEDLEGEEDLPTNEEYDKAWARYNRFAAETGEDPLSQIAVPTRTTQTWTAKLRPSILGYVLVAARRAGRASVQAHDAPQEMLDWLLLTRPVGGVYRTDESVSKYKELVKMAVASDDCKATWRGSWLYLTRGYEVRRSEKEIERDVRETARGRRK